MSAFDEYANRFMAALYVETVESGSEFHSARSIHQKYGLVPENLWVNRMADEWEHQYFKDVAKVLDSYDNWSFRISPEGYRKVESDFRDVNEVKAFLGKGSKATIEGLSAKLVPAADQVVKLDQNEPLYGKVQTGLTDIKEDLRSRNDLSVSPEERDRVICSLAAAETLWGSSSLRILQLKVGILLAVEDARRILKDTAKAAAAALLVDAIKSFVKSNTGIDLDTI